MSSFHITSPTFQPKSNISQQPIQYVQLNNDQITLLLYAHELDKWNQMHYPRFHGYVDDVLRVLLLNNVTQQSIPSSVYNNPPQIQQTTPTDSNNNHLQTICEEEVTQFLNPHSPAFYPRTPSPSPSPLSPLTLPSPPMALNTKKRVKCKEKLIPKYPHRAQLNVFIAKDITARSLDIILEQFPTAESLYYYMDISTGLQLNDDQMYQFNINDEAIVFVNYDLHRKDTGDPLYGVIGLNEEHDSRKNKWRWKLLALKTANDIQYEYGVCYTELPLSSRRMDYFQKELETQSSLVHNIDPMVIDMMDWSNIRQIKSLRRKKDKQQYYGQMGIALKTDINMWIEQCKNEWNTAPSIPIVVNGSKQKSHWIEWIKLIPVRNDECIGVSCRYLSDDNEWCITSVCLDKGDVENKHRLLGLSTEHKEIYIPYLKNFNKTFTEIQWIKSNYRGILFH